MAEPVDPVHHRRLVHGARCRTVPLNVKCKARCAFCYDSRVSQLLPHVRTEYIQPYDEQRFDAFRQMCARACEWERETGREPAYGSLPTFELTARGMAHFPNCDIFSAGLSHGQIEELVRMHEGDSCLLYAVGLNIDPEFIAYLTDKYADTFRLHLSIVTFQPEIRQQLMHPDIDVEVLRRVCQLTRHATFFLLLFDERQLGEDVEEILSTTTAESGGVFIHKLYYDRCSPQRVVDYATAAEPHREAAVRHVAGLAWDGRPLMFSLGGDIQAYTRRDEIYTMLAACTGQADEAILCSGGAHRVIEHYCQHVPNVTRPMECVFGGNLDLIQGATARGAIERLEALFDEGRALRQVFLPDAMFWIEGGYDVNGDRIDGITETFPELSVKLLPVPAPVICSVVDLADCLAFFDNPERASFESPLATGGHTDPGPCEH